MAELVDPGVPGGIGLSLLSGKEDSRAVGLGFSGGVPISLTADEQSRLLLREELEPSCGDGNVAPTPVGLLELAAIHMKIQVEIVSFKQGK